VRLKRLVAIGAALLSLTACNRTMTPSNPTPAPNPMSAFIGSWHSTTTTGACTAINWSVASTNNTTATILYTATCAGVPVTGTAAGTLNGTTMNWTTSGTAANTCTFAINGGAAPAAIATDLNVTYTGNVCGTPVSGSDTLHR